MGESTDSSVQTGRSEESERSSADAKSTRRLRLRWSALSYTTRMTLAFALIAAMTALVAIGVLSFVWDQHFRTYTQDNMASLAESTAANIEAIYEETGTLYDQQVVAAAEYAASLNSGVGIIVRDNSNGSVVWDSSTVDLDGDDEGDVSYSSSVSDSSSLSLSPSYASDGQVAYANIEYDGVAVGSVHVWVMGSESLLRAADEEFRDNSYQAMMFATVLAIVLASCIGFLFARKLVSPINRISNTAKAIKEGDLSARTGLSGEDEIAKLGETFDEMAESVERDRKLERRLTTDVAHELRTPLMAIQSTVEAMVDGVFEADEERLETVNTEVQRLSRLVDAILKLSRLENRSTPLHLSRVNVGELIDGIVATHEAFVVDSGLQLAYERDPEVYVLGDSDMIRQATANLISNAVRYTPEGGRITVRVFQKDGMASIQVQDTGIGLSPEEAKMVFSRFWRADAGRARESGGLGIGLSVVKEIVDQHNGWVDVQGRRNEGACFTINIPLYDPDDPRLAPGDADKAQKSRENRSKTKGGKR